MLKNADECVGKERTKKKNELDTQFRDLISPSTATSYERLFQFERTSDEPWNEARMLAWVSLHVLTSFLSSRLDESIILQVL